MISENIYDNLIESLKENFSEIARILKSLGNEKRLEILIYLLRGVQSYGSIVQEANLKKTAVSNHLSQLINANLIKRGKYGIYELSGDGIEFIKAIEKAYQQSPTRQIERFEALQRRSISTSFLNRFSS